MAGPSYSGGTLYNKTGSTSIYTWLRSSASIITVADVINTQEAIAAGITEVSNTIGGTPLNGNIVLENIMDEETGKTYLYDVTPESQAETITGFYLDGTEYTFGGSGKADKTEVLVKDNTTPFTPTGDYQPATKKYVDDNAGTEYNSGEGIVILNGTNYSLKKGPCQIGYHVPSKLEFETLSNMLVSIGTSSIQADLKFPKNYRIDYNGGGTLVRSSSFDLWTNTRINSSNVYSACNSSSSIGFSGISSSEALPIRPFKDNPIMPDNTRTVIKGSLGNAGIFWKSSLGLISIYDGSNCITISDKNLGATIVWNYGDEVNDENCGKLFQRGNNYGFPCKDPVKTSRTKIDASGYGPLNPYYSDTYILSTGDRSSVTNSNLWGSNESLSSYNNEINNIGVTSINDLYGDVKIIQYGGNGINISDNTISMSGYIDKGDRDYSAMQGPCSNGYHIPTENEWRNVINMWANMFPNDYSNAFKSRLFGTSLKLPIKGKSIDYYDGEYDSYVDSMTKYWTCSEFSVTSAYCLYVGDGNSAPIDIKHENMANGYKIRPFYNKKVYPDNSWAVLKDGSSYHTGAGIFWKSSLGLISIYDGSNCITISDKNLGATTVWNYGDDITAANHGYCFQRGNNNGWSYGVNPTTVSGTAIDASSYGPGNYYSSSTFIKSRLYKGNGISEGDAGYYIANLWGGLTLGIINRNIITGNGYYNIVISNSIPGTDTSNNTITISTGSTKGLYVGTTKIA